MANTWKRLGQVVATTTTQTEVYACPADTSFIGKLFLANPTTGNVKVRVALIGDGETLATANYLAYDLLLPGNSTIEITGVVGSGGDSVSVYADNDIAVTLTGVEIA